MRLPQVRAFPILAVLILAGAAFSQQLAARVSMCGGWTGNAFDIPVVCGVTAFVEFPAPGVGELGVYGQVSPRYGYPWDNWLLYVYVPDVRLSLGDWVDARTWPGVAVGRELGEWTIMVRADFLLTFDLSP